MLSAGDVEWIQQFAGDEARAVAVSGNVYVTGEKFLAGQRHGSLRAYDPSGAEIWTRHIDSTPFVVPTALTVDTSGIYMVGDLAGSLPGHTSAGGQDVFIIKYDFSGNELWSRQFGSSANDFGRDVAADATGIYVLIEDRFFGFGVPGTGVSKFDHSGNPLWTRFVAFERGEAIAVNPSGIYTTGSHFIGGSADYSVLHGFDLDLNEIWTQEIESSVARDVAVTNSGVFVTGTVAGALPGQINTGYALDAFLQRYDLEGNLIWTRQFTDGHAFSLALDESAAYVAGQINTIIVPDPENPGISEDAFVSKFTLDGREVWRTELTSAAGDHVESVAIDESGVYASGRLNFSNFLAKLEPGTIFNVAVDVKPGSEQNSTNLASQGAIAVAILSTSLAAGDLLDFDATLIDASTVAFADAFAFQSAFEDVDYDGDLDLVLHYRLEDTNLDEAYAELVADDVNVDGILDSKNQVVEASLFGKTLAGDALVGSNEINLFLSGKQLRDLLDELFA
jgi:outer membrane protein assembly factor BamB